MRWMERFGLTLMICGVAARAQVDTGTIKDQPLNGRNFAQLIGAVAGVVPAQTQSQGLALTAIRGTTANAVNGMGFRANRFLVDGLDKTESHNGCFSDRCTGHRKSGRRARGAR